jgi:hypothetical protein
MKRQTIRETRPARKAAAAARRALLLIAALLFCTSASLAQSKLGEVLDAGATLLTVDEFKAQLVQRTLEGPTPTGGHIELMYVSNGTIQGTGASPLHPSSAPANMPYEGDWTSGENGTICSSFRYRSAGGGAAGNLPLRCQYWFKLGDRYFVSDSDYDRQARVLVRTVKR